MRQLTRLKPFSSSGSKKPSRALKKGKTGKIGFILSTWRQRLHVLMRFTYENEE
jgi:hypothetical protein